MGGRCWDDASDAVIREHYQGRGARWCADRLPGRTLGAVRYRAKALGRIQRGVNTPIPTTPIIDAMISAAYRGDRPKGWRNTLARRTGRSCTWVSTRAIELGLTISRDVRPWMQEELDYADANAATTATVLAKRMRRKGWYRTASAIARKRVQGGIMSVHRTVQDDDPDRFNAEQLAACFGVSTTALVYWIRHGWLIADTIRSGNGTGSLITYVIRAQDVAAFALANPTRVSFTKLEPNKVWFLDLIARFPRLPSREDGTLQRRIRSVAAARPELSEAEIASLVATGIDVVRAALRRRQTLIDVQREAA